jgi:hypothetical protein
MDTPFMQNLQFRHYRVPRPDRSGIWGGDSHCTAWKEGTIGHLAETYCGKGMYLGCLGHFCGTGNPRKDIR